MCLCLHHQIIHCLDISLKLTHTVTNIKTGHTAKMQIAVQTNICNIYDSNTEHRCGAVGGDGTSENDVQMKERHEPERQGGVTPSLTLSSNN